MKQPLGDIEPRSESEWNMLEQVYLGASVLKRITSSRDMYKDRDHILLIKQSVTSKGNRNCTLFKPSRSMKWSMTSQVLYPTGEESDPNYLINPFHDDSAIDQ